MMSSMNANLFIIVNPMLEYFWRNLKVLSTRDMYCLTMNLTVFDNMAITKSGRNQEENVVVRQHMSVK